MQNSSTKSLPLSSTSSFDAVARGFRDEDDLDEVVLFQVITFVTCCGGSTQTLRFYNMMRRKEYHYLLVTS